MKTFFLMATATAVLVAADTSLMAQSPTPTTTPSPTPAATPTPGPSKAESKKSHQRRAEGGPTYEPAATPKQSEEQE